MPDLGRPYTVITADTHAGASIDSYREYLDPSHRADFDAWRGRYKNPAKKHVGSKKTKNWDSAERLADLESDGVVGEVIFPNTVPRSTTPRFTSRPRPRPSSTRVTGPARGLTIAGWPSSAPTPPNVEPASG